MRKTYQIIGMMCMAALLAIGATSCKKENSKVVSSFGFKLPAVEGESPLAEEKAYLDLTDNKMKWYDGDLIRVYSIDGDWTQSKSEVYFAQSGITGQTEAYFGGTPLVEGSLGYFAFYPASKSSATIEEGNRAYFNVGNTQKHTTDLFAGTGYDNLIFMDPTCIVAAATCDVIEPHVVASLKHIFGFVTVRLKDTDNSGKKVTKVTIKDSQLHLTGSISIEIPKLTETILNNMKSLGQQYKAGTDDIANTYAATLNNYLHQIGYLSDPDGDEVTLDCTATGGVLINNSYKFFFMPIRPGALMKGFTVTLTYDDNNTKTYTVPADKKYITIPGTYTNVSINLASGVL